MQIDDDINIEILNEKEHNSVFISSRKTRVAAKTYEEFKDHNSIVGCYIKIEVKRSYHFLIVYQNDKYTCSIFIRLICSEI